MATIQDIWDGKILPNECIPEIQRGLVWNAAQIEVFWDSLLRGIPIGVFTVVDGELFDGQQRWHAIRCAKNADPEGGILWIGLEIFKDSLYGRKYLFRWTTKSHPWGFKYSDERKAERLTIDLRRKTLCNSGRSNENLFIAPNPGDIVPYSNENITFVKFYDLINQEQPPEKLDDNEKTTWLQLHKTVLALVQKGDVISVIKYSRPKNDPEWDNIFFTRFNRQGTPFDDYELLYSALKASFPKEDDFSVRSLFEEMAKGITRPAILAQVVLDAAKTEIGFNNPLTPVAIRSYISDKNNREVLLKKIEEIAERIKRFKQIVAKFNESEDTFVGILPTHLSAIAISSDSLMYIVIRSLGIVADDSSKTLLGGIFLLFFMLPPHRQKYSYPSLKKIFDDYCVRAECFNFNSFIALAMHKGIIRPLYPDELKEIKVEDLSKGSFSADPLKNAYFSIKISGSFFNWGSSAKFVDLACGRYLREKFPSYLENVDDDMRPWDYDHLAPKDRFSDEDQGYFVCWSSGNNVPIALTTNRAKQDQWPDELYPENNGEVKKMLYLPDELNSDSWETSPQNFINIAWTRFRKMYAEVFKRLEWGVFLQQGETIPLDDSIERILRATFVRNDIQWMYMEDSCTFKIHDINDFYKYTNFELRLVAEDKNLVLATDLHTYFEVGDNRKPSHVFMGYGVQWWDADPEYKSTLQEAIEFFLNKAGLPRLNFENGFA